MLVDSRPLFDDEEGRPLRRVVADTEKALTFYRVQQGLTDNLLNRLAEVVRAADMPDMDRLWLLYGIGQLRGEASRKIAYVRAEAKGRDN